LLSDAEIQYMVLTIEVKDQGEAEKLFSTSKTIFITWVGTECKPMAKAKSSQHRLPLYNYVLVRTTTTTLTPHSWRHHRTLTHDTT
jgi:hypothetical protein